MRHKGEDWLMKQNTVKKYITEALFLLLEKKQFQEITVKEVVEKAGVCRASFYRNYLMLERVIDEFLENIFDEILSANKVNEDTMEKDIADCFAQIIKYKREFKILADRNLFYKVNELLYQKTLEEIYRLQVFHNQYQPHFFAGASSAMLRAWVDNDFIDPPERIAQIFMESLHGYMDV